MMSVAKIILLGSYVVQLCCDVLEEQQPLRNIGTNLRASPYTL